MKYLFYTFFKRYIYLILAFLVVFSCDSDNDTSKKEELNNCPTTRVGEVAIKSQEDLDRFCECKYKRIEGRLTLEGVTDISGLHNLEEVHQIRIFNTQLINLEGLNNLKILNGYKDPYYENRDIEGEIWIAGNPELTSLDGLSSLVEIPRLIVSDNNKLLDFCEFSGDLVNNELYEVSGNNFNPSLDDLINETKCRSEKYINEKVYDGDISILPYHGSNRDGNFVSVEDFGKLGYTKINGSLQIALSGSLESLAGLNELTGNLILGYYYYEDGTQFAWGNGFENLKGLDSLKSIGGDFQLIASSVKSVDELLNLTHIGGSLNASLNPLLENIDGLINVTSELNNNLTLYGNNALENINGLSNAKTQTLNKLEFGNLPNLTDLNILSNLTSLNSLFINHLNNEAVSKMSFLMNLKELNSLRIKSANHIKDLDWLSISSSSLIDIVLENNKVLENLNALSSIAQIDGQLAILNNSNLIDLVGLGGVKTVLGDVSIKDNNGLSNLKGIELLTSITGDVFIENNNSLISFEGLNGLKQVDGSFNIYENKSLNSFEGLNNLEVVYKNFYTSRTCWYDTIAHETLCSYSSSTDQEIIIDISALSKLNTVGETLALINLDVTNLDGLQSLTSVGSLQIKNNQKLLSLEGLAQSNFISNSIVVSNNTLLTNLDAFSNIENLNLLNISNNMSLTSFCGFKNTILPTSSDNFYIGGNAYNPTIVQINTDEGCAN